MNIMAGPIAKEKKNVAGTIAKKSHLKQDRHNKEEG